MLICEFIFVFKEPVCLIFFLSITLCGDFSVYGLVQVGQAKIILCTQILLVYSVVFILSFRFWMSCIPWGSSLYLHFL